MRHPQQLTIIKGGQSAESLKLSWCLFAKSGSVPCCHLLQVLRQTDG